MGEFNVGGSAHLHPLNPCKHAIPSFFSGGYCLPPVHPCVNYPLSFYGASALNVYPLQNHPPVLIELVRRGGQLVCVWGGYLECGQHVMSLPPLVHPKNLFQGPPLQPTLFSCVRRRRRKN